MDQQLTYTVRELFTAADTAPVDGPAGLADYQADDFLIAAYQRGYKWKAEGGLVANLLTTLYEAYETGQADYYLQYLTVKRQPGPRPTLEVIDGQQRLTTLTVFFGVGAAADWLAGPNFTAQRLHYDIRSPQGHSLLDRYVYDVDALRRLLGIECDAPADWDEFVAGQPAGTDRQDMYHLFEAARCIYRFGEALEAAERPDFWAYVADRARLIVNAVAATTASETVFANLNDNRKELTDLDLVKGLLLTRPAREGSNSFRQILELRTAQGRQWDEMAQWMAQPAVAAVFGLPDPTGQTAEPGGQPGLRLLVELLAERDEAWLGGGQQAGGRFPLYAFWRTRLAAGLDDGRAASDLLRELRELYQVLRDWYDDPLLRNGLGMLQASRDYGAGKFRKLLGQLTQARAWQARPPRAVVWQAIGKLACLRPLRKVADAGPEDPTYWPANYGDDRVLIQDLLLLLSVFPPQARHSGGAVPFDFATYRQQSWSLEHIFPQNPDASFQELPGPDQAELLKLVDKGHRKAVRALLATPLASRSDEDKETLKNLLTATTGRLDSLGNLVLLRMDENIPLRNYSFARKRKLLAEKVAQGAFVPAHTFGVFAKLVPGSATDRLGLWGPAEMKDHQDYVLAERWELQKYFAT